MRIWVMDSFFIWEEYGRIIIMTTTATNNDHDHENIWLNMLNVHEANKDHYSQISSPLY